MPSFQDQELGLAGDSQTGGAYLNSDLRWGYMLSPWKDHLEGQGLWEPLVMAWAFGNNPRAGPDKRPQP